MEFNIFGLRFGSKKVEEPINPPTNIPEKEDGAVVNETDFGFGSRASGFLSFGFSFEETFKDQKTKIESYRRMAKNPYVSHAIDEIVNEAIAYDVQNGVVSLELDGTDFSESIKKKLNAEFKDILRIIKFDFEAHDIFRNWYVDGQSYAHILVDPNNTKEGILGVRFVDPRFMRKIVEIERDKNNVEVRREEFFAYFPEEQTKEKRKNKNVIGNKANEKEYITKYNKDSVIYTWSGLLDEFNNPISYLHYAIQPYNQLDSMETALLIYRLSRAPEKRLFSIETFGLPKSKAEQYVATLIDKYRNKATYDSNTGELKNNTQIQSMFQDYWFPRKDGKGSDVTSIGGTSGTFGDKDELDRFLKKLYKAMKIPESRVENQPTPYGKGSEITRDELKFQKFIDRIRNRFSEMLHELLKRQLLLKNVLTLEDWVENDYQIRFKFSQDSLFSEFKNAEILDMRLDALSKIKDYIGKKKSTTGFFNKQWVQKNILMLTDDQISEMEEGQDEEEALGYYEAPEGEGGFGVSPDIGPETGMEPPSPGPTGTETGDGSTGIPSEPKIKEPSGESQ